MIKFNGTDFQFDVYKATFTDNGEPRTQYGNNRQYWEKMVAQWGHLNDLSIQLVEPTADQEQRLQDLNNQQGLDENWIGSAMMFVEHGVIMPDSDCPFLDGLKSAYYDTTVDYFKGVKRDELAAYRYAEEVGGITFNSYSISTDRGSQGLLSNAVAKAEKDSTFMVDWKTNSGFVTLDAPTLVTLGNAVSDHVEKCFSAECKVDRDHISLATDLDSLDSMDVVNLFEGYYNV